MPSSSASSSGRPSTVAWTIFDSSAVVGVATALGDPLAEVVGDGVAGLLADARGALDVARRDVGADGVVAPLEELREVLGRAGP